MEAALKDNYESLTAWIIDLARSELERRKWRDASLAKPKNEQEEKP